jgi:hypothetical protein
MERHTIESTINAYLTEMRAQLEGAASIAKVAEARQCRKGNWGRLGIEESIYEVNTFFNAASMIKRLGKTWSNNPSSHSPFPASAVRPPRGFGGDGTWCRINRWEES